MEFTLLAIALVVAFYSLAIAVYAHNRIDRLSRNQREVKSAGLKEGGE